MTQTKTPTPTIRRFETDDTEAVLSLLTRAMGGGPTGARSRDFFTWKHLDNPSGPSLMLVAEVDDRIVGLRAFMRWRLQAGGQLLHAARPVDTATDPDHQGRGIFARLTSEALTCLSGVDLIFNTPNEKSLPGYLKLGWQVVGRVPISIRVRRPLRFVRGLSTVKTVSGGSVGGPAPSAREMLSDRTAVEELLAAAADLPGISTPRSFEHMWWRYATAPELDYRIIADIQGATLRGLIVFRVRRRGSLVEATIADCIVRSGDVASARRLLSRVASDADADHIAASWPRRSECRRAAVQRGFLRTPGGMTLVVRSTRSMPLDPSHLDNWNMTLGDLEVF